MSTKKMFTADELQRLYQYAYSLCNDQDYAYDLVQTTVESYLRQESAPENKMSYARAILRNRFIDVYRHKTKFPSDPYVDEVVSLDIELQSLEQTVIQQDELEKAWNLLSSDETEILYLWAVEGMTIANIATQLNTPKGTLLARIHRLRKRLKDVLSVSSIGDIA